MYRCFWLQYRNHRLGMDRRGERVRVARHHREAVSTLDALPESRNREQSDRALLTIGGEILAALGQRSSV